jgi:hypothetical protein
MVDTLSGCLDACTRLRYDRIKIDCQIFDDFRSLVFRLLRRFEGESENIFKRKLRRKLWQFVINLSSTPLPWDCPIEQHLELEPNSFERIVREQYGSEFDAVASGIITHWSDRMRERYSNPVYAELIETVSTLRDKQFDFRILASNRQRTNYEPLLQELEVSDADVFSSFAALKSLPPFDCLVTCGPFREDIDAIFTAPKFGRLVNVRWSRDDDVPGFPNYMTFGNVVPDAEEEFPADFPVRVVLSETQKVIETVEDPDTPDATKSVANWSYDGFESLFVRRNRVRRKNGRLSDKRSTKRSTPTHPFASVQLHFIDGSYWSLGFDQSNKPPLLYSIDRDGDHTPTKRRVALDDQISTDSELLPGMLVVVEPPASSALREMALEEHAVSRSHLAEWKALLRSAVKELGHDSLRFKFQTLGHPVENVESKMQRWMSRTSGINAPQDYETFSVVVGKFAGYPEVDAAWEEVLHLRGASIQDGRVRESNIDEYLLSSVLKNFEQLIDEPRTEIDVEGFEEPAVVIELSHVEFFLEGQLSQLGTYRRMEDRD